MKAPIVTVYTNDNNLWLLQGFQYLFKKYWSSSQKTRVVGYAQPKNGTLAENFYFVSIDSRNYPVSDWSTGVIESLNVFRKNGEEFIIFMLEDYWLTEPVNHAALRTLTEYMHEQPRNILRVDLTADRCQYRRYALGTSIVGNCELVRTSADSPYQMSFQAGIWNVELLLEVLRPYENPWQTEIAGSKRLAKAGNNKYLVYGTRNYPVRYQPVYRTKRASIDISRLKKEDHDLVLKRGWV
jgi:hypothetical protein